LSWLDDVLPEARLGSVPVLSPVTLLEKERIKSLANALHIAQDGASHGEGVQGYGHDDISPRVLTSAGTVPSGPLRVGSHTSELAPSKGFQAYPLFPVRLPSPAGLVFRVQSGA